MQSVAIPGAVSLALEGSWLSCGHFVIVMLWSCGSFYHALPNFRWKAGTLFMQFRTWGPVPIPMFMRLELPLSHPTLCGSSYHISIITHRTIHTTNERRIQTAVAIAGVGRLLCACKIVCGVVLCSYSTGPGLQNSSRVIKKRPPFPLPLQIF